MLVLPGVFTVVWLCCIFLLSTVSIPGPEGQDPIPHADKFAHAFLYGVLMFLWLWEVRRKNVYTAGSLLLVVAVAFLYGLTIELVQWKLPNRTFETGDLVANSAGIAAGVSMFLFIYQLDPREKK